MNVKSNNKGYTVLYNGRKGQKFKKTTKKDDCPMTKLSKGNNIE